MADLAVALFEIAASFLLHTEKPGKTVTSGYSPRGSIALKRLDTAHFPSAVADGKGGSW
jgi:hypothetical protein